MAGLQGRRSAGGLSKFYKDIFSEKLLAAESLDRLEGLRWV
jgi:hypothetical protein